MKPVSNLCSGGLARLGVLIYRGPIMHFNDWTDDDGHKNATHSEDTSEYSDAFEATGSRLAKHLIALMFNFLHI